MHTKFGTVIQIQLIHHQSFFQLLLWCRQDLNLMKKQIQVCGQFCLDRVKNSVLLWVETEYGNNSQVLIIFKWLISRFLVVILTHNRDSVLFASLERLNRCPYLNKVLVVWNNLDRQPPNTWPKLHVPLIFVRAKTNSLNNRFLPYDQVKQCLILNYFLIF